MCSSRYKLLTRFSIELTHRSVLKFCWQTKKHRFQFWPLPSKHLLVLKTSSTRLQRNNFTSSKTSWRRLEDVLRPSCKTSSRRLQDVAEDEKSLRWRRIEDVVKTCLEVVLKTCLEDIFKTCLKDVLKTCLHKQNTYWGYLYTYLGMTNLNVYLTSLHFTNLYLTILWQI